MREKMRLALSEGEVPEGFRSGPFNQIALDWWIDRMLDTLMEPTGAMLLEAASVGPCEIGHEGCVDTAKKMLPAAIRAAKEGK